MKHDSFIYNTDAWILTIALFLLMVVCIYVGRWLGLRRIVYRKETDAPSTTNILSAMLGLMAFLLAFTFSMSSNRYDARRRSIVDEANAIGTATLRSDLYPEDQRALFRKDFQQYVEARIAYFEVGAHKENVDRTDSLSDEIAHRIWDRAANFSKTANSYIASVVMVNALNEMIDLRTTRTVAEFERVPDSIVWMLLILLLANAFYIGYSSAGKGHFDWFIAFGFCLLASVVIYITLNLDRPRRGIIQMNHSQNAMVELRKLFGTK
jgi:hypothetical protein